MSSTAAFILAMMAVVFIVVLFIVEAVHGNLNIKAKTEMGSMGMHVRRHKRRLTGTTW